MRSSAGSLIQGKEIKSKVYCTYHKIYLPRESDDVFLASVIAPLVDEIMGSKVADYFFFLRYSDPGYHLRLRFFSRSRSILGDPLKLINERLSVATRGRKDFEVTKDRYRPEWNRYGGHLGVRVAERIFHASSRSVLEFLKLRQAGCKVSRAEFGLVSVESMLDAIGIGRAARQDFFAEHGNSTLEHMAAQQNAAAANLESLFEPIVRKAVSSPRSYWKDRDSGLHELTQRLYADLKPVALSWNAIAKEIHWPVRELASSYLHMHVNRLALFPAEEQVLRSARHKYAGLRS